MLHTYLFRPVLFCLQFQPGLTQIIYNDALFFDIYLLRCF